jgi:quercetin dioxygenase-like cupin family protein
VEIRRFGPGHRRPDGPPGTKGVTGQVIHNDERGVVAELAFQRFAIITPHSNPNTTLFMVISGGGYVQVGDERARVNHGEVVVWPADVVHGAYTDGSEMRAIVIELPEGAPPSGILEGSAMRVLHPGEAAAGRGDVPAPPTEGNAGFSGDRDGVDADWPPSAGAAGPGDAAATERPAAPRPTDPAPSVERARGGLAERPASRDDYDSSSGEPW